MTTVAVILYEDQRGKEKEFGLHNLVVACVADDLGKDVFTLCRAFEAHPTKGVSNLLRSCRQDVHRLGARGQRVFALIDADKIREQLRHEGVPASADDDAVVRAIKAEGRCVAPDQLEVVLLKENTETVIQAAKLCDKELPDAAVEQALRKDVNARDRILNNVAYGKGRAVRDCIRGKVPAIQALAGALRDLFTVRSVMDS